MKKLWECYSESSFLILCVLLIVKRIPQEEEDAAKEYAFRRSSNSICYIVMSKNSKFELKVDWFYTLCSNKAAATVCSFDRRQLASSSKKILCKNT